MAISYSRKLNKKFPKPWVLTTAVYYQQIARLLKYKDSLGPSFKAPTFAVVVSSKFGALRDGPFWLDEQVNGLVHAGNAWCGSVLPNRRSICLHNGWVDRPIINGNGILKNNKLVSSWGIGVYRTSFSDALGGKKMENKIEKNLEIIIKLVAETIALNEKALKAAMGLRTELEKLIKNNLWIKNVFFILGFQPMIKRPKTSWSH
jgi:hypothetical protein